MKTSTFESLPNELILMIFEYLADFDLCQTLISIKNRRLERLFLNKRHSFVVSSLRYNQMCRLIDVNNDTTFKYFTNMIETLVLDESYPSTIFFNHLTERMQTSSTSDLWLPSMTQLIAFKPDRHSFKLIPSLLVPIRRFPHPLRRLHFIFEQPAYEYSSFLSNLVSNRISVDTMILEVKRGYDFYSIRHGEDLHEMQTLHWPFTTRLTLSIQHASELVLLLERQALPALEHLNVTIEQTDITFTHELILDNRVSPEKLIDSADADRLRTLFIRHIAFEDLNVLLSVLPMPSLQKLTLIDVYDESLQSLDRFYEICRSGRFKNLKDLYFSFRFPESLEQDWKSNCSVQLRSWPFEQLGSFKNEYLIYDHRRLHEVQKTFFIIYKEPLEILLEYTRTLHNHCFAIHASSPMMTNRAHSIEWTCNRIDEPDQTMKTLEILANGRVKSLSVKYLFDRTSMKMKPSSFLRRGLSFHHLRSFTFNCGSTSANRLQRMSIVQQILDASPNLKHLVVAWRDLRYCSQSYPNLRHLHIVLDHSSYKDQKPFDVERLSILAPGIRRLETSLTNLIPDQNLVDFIWEIITRFDQLINLVLNKDSLYPSKEEEKLIFRQSFFDAGRSRQYDSHSVHIHFRIRDEISIWL